MRFQCAITLFSLLFVSSVGFSQNPPSAPVAISIQGQLAVPEDTPADLTVVGTTGAVAWVILPQVNAITYGQRCQFLAPPGKYSVIAVAISGGQPITAQVSVTLGNSAKPLGIAIFDPQTLTSLPVGQVAIYQSPTIAASLASAGVTWLVYQSGDVVPAKGGSIPLNSTTWGKAAAQVGLPALVMCGNGVTTAFPLPATEQAIIGCCKRMKK